MWRYLAWVGKLIGTVMVGPGAVVLGDPGLDPAPIARTSRERLAYGLAALAPVVLVMLAIFPIVPLPWLLGIGILLVLPAASLWLRR